MNDDERVLVEAARQAARTAYAPYSNFHVGAALRFADGAVVTGCNVENASYGLALCAETVAVAKAMQEGRRGGLVQVAVTGPEDRGGPEVLCVGPAEVRRTKLSELLPAAFGPASLA